MSSVSPGISIASAATRKALEQARVLSAARKMAHYDTIRFILFSFNRGMSVKRMREIWGENLVELAIEMGGKSVRTEAKAA